MITKSFLPHIWRGGMFDSRRKFGEIVETKERTARHFEMELFCEDGGCCFVNGNPCQLHRGNLLIAGPGDRRYSRLHFTCLYVHFEVFDSEMEQFVRFLPGFMQEDLWEELAPLFEQLHRCMTSGEEHGEIHAATALMALLCRIDELQKSRIRDELLENEENPVGRALSYMHRHYRERISVEEAAAYAGFSVSYLHKRFLETVGVPPNTYLNNIRIARARELLAQGDDPLCIVAENCGFSSQTYFNYIFKKSVGTSPGKFREDAQYPISG